MPSRSLLRSSRDSRDRVGLVYLRRGCFGHPLVVRGLSSSWRIDPSLLPSLRSMKRWALVLESASSATSHPRHVLACPVPIKITHLLEYSICLAYIESPCYIYLG